MKHVQIINRKTIRLLLLIFVLTFCMAPVSSYADGPWTDRADQSIYDSTGDAPDSSTPDMLDGGIFAELLGEFCIGIGDGLNFLLTSFGCDLNAIIFGRVGGASARTGDVALFSFDMGTGNIYGLPGHRLSRSPVPVLLPVPFSFQKPLFPPDPKYQLPSFTPFIVRAILFLSISTLKIFTSTTSPTLTASNGCLI